MVDVALCDITDNLTRNRITACAYFQFVSCDIVLNKFLSGYAILHPYIMFPSLDVLFIYFLIYLYFIYLCIYLFIYLYF